MLKLQKAFRYLSKRSLPFVFLLFTIVYTSDCFSSPSSDALLGAPVFSKNQSIFSYNRLSVGNDFLDRNSKKLVVMPECVGSNTITKLKNIDVDYESYNCNLYFEQSIWDMRVSFNGGLVTTGGGVFDSLIESYHEGLGLPNGERGGTPENRFSAEGIAPNGARYSISESDLILLDPQVSLTIPLNVNDFFKKKLFLDVSATIPFGFGQFGINKPEMKSSLVYQNKYGKRLSYLGGLSGVIHLDDMQFGARYDRYSYGLFGSVQYLMFENFAIFLQNVVSSNFESKFTDLENHFWYLDAGLRFPVSDQDVVEFAVRENPSPSAGTVDVSVIVRYIISNF